MCLKTLAFALFMKPWLMTSFVQQEEKDEPRQFAINLFHISVEVTDLLAAHFSHSFPFIAELNISHLIHHAH